MRPQNRGAEEILNKRYCYEGPKNNFGIVTYNINYGTAARTMKDTILMVHNLSEMLKNSVDYMVSSVAFNSFILLYGGWHDIRNTWDTVIY